MSPLLNHKDQLIKISSEDLRNFRVSILSDKEKKSIHNFLWLNLVNRKDELKIIQKIIKEWINKYRNYKKDIWSNNLIGIRIISWISNTDLILDREQKSFNQLFLKSLIRQINFIKKNLNDVTDEDKKIVSISAIILSGLVFRDYYSNYKFGLKELKKLIESFLIKMVFPKIGILKTLFYLHNILS